MNNYAWIQDIHSQIPIFQYYITFVFLCPFSLCQNGKSGRDMDPARTCFR